LSNPSLAAGGLLGRRLVFAIVFALCGATGESVSAQIPANATPEELKKIKDEATARREAYEAVLAAENARRALETSQVNGDQAAATKAAKDLADARKAQADAQKAEADAALAAAKAKFGEIPDSGYKGSAEMGTNAGNAEAMLLGSVAVNTIAGKLASSLKADKPAEVKRLLLYTSQTVPDFQALLAFNAQYDALDLAVRKAQDATKGADAEIVASLAMGVATVGLGFDAINKVLGFFKSDFKFQGIDVASSDGMLLASLAQSLRKQGIGVEVPATYQPGATEGARAMLDRVALLYEWAQRARQKIQQLGEALKRREAEHAQHIKNKADSEAEKLAPRIAKVKEAIAIWTAVADRIDAWAKQTSGADDKGDVPLATIVRHAAVRASLEDGGALVVLQLHKVAGTGYTKKNLWSSLGANPFFVMGGAVASVMAFHGKTGEVFSSALVPWHGGYHSVSDIEAVVNR